VTDFQSPPPPDIEIARAVKPRPIAEVAADLQQLLHNLQVISGRLEQGEGTVGRLLEDPSLYEAMNDVAVGVDESRFLRWLVRNRQKKGIKKRYREAQEEQPETENEEPTASGNGG